MNSIQYKVSFTTGGLYYREAVKTAHLFFELKDWDLVHNIIIKDNLLQARTHSSLVRTSRELIQRLEILTDEQLQIVVFGSRQEQNQILWLAVCKHYDLIMEFAIEVIHEKFRKLDPDLDYRDFDAFFFSKAEWNEGLELLTETTRKKLRQVLFRMLREAELLSAGGEILPAILSARVLRAIEKDELAYLSIYPAPDYKHQRK